MARGPGLAGRVEWVLGAVSALLVLAVVGFLVREGLGPAAAPPDLRVAEAPSSVPGQIRFAVGNRGGRTARSVTVALVLGAERRTLTVDYVPAHSEVTGGFLLPPGVDRAETGLEVEGYLDP